MKSADGEIVEEGRCRRNARLTELGGGKPAPWQGAMEATLFSGWIYDTLKPYAQQLEMAHPAMMKAIGAAKKKSDRIDARKIADMLRCDLLPGCYVAPPEIRELRRLMRYRSLVVRQSVRMKNKIAGLLMEVGAPFNKEKLHGKKYFHQLLDQLEEVPESVQDLLRLSRGAMEMFRSAQRRLLARCSGCRGATGPAAEEHSGGGRGHGADLGPGDRRPAPVRFHGSDAVSYCGLTSALHSSADKQQRGPISKQRNALCRPR